jgi:cytoskeleton protein RodZ
MPEASGRRTVGARLREAREQRGLTLRQIAGTTRISVMSLEALERSDVARLPGGIFTRAFLRTYAHEVGLDPDEIVDDFITELPSSLASAAMTAQVEDNEKLESDRAAASTLVTLIGVSLLLGAGVLYVQRHPAALTDRPVAEVQGPAATVEQRDVPAVATAAAQTNTSSPADSVPAAVQAAALTMEIMPRGDCWISVTADGEHVFSALLKAGDRRQVTAREDIRLNVGNAGTFVYTLNGKMGRPLGGSGQNVSAKITAARYGDYLVP